MIKRIFDITVALIGLVILIPILAVVAILIKLDSPGPVFFRDKRIGQDGKIFYTLKFRSMVPDAPQKGAAILLEKVAVLFRQSQALHDCSPVKVPDSTRI